MLAVFEVLAGLAQFCHQVFPMPKQGRFAGAVLPAKGLKSITSGQKGQVDVMALGMVTDGAFHGFLRNQGSGVRGQGSGAGARN